MKVTKSNLPDEHAIKTKIESLITSEPANTSHWNATMLCQRQGKDYDLGQRGEMT